MSKDWTGGSALFNTNNRKLSATDADNDFYATHPDTVKLFLDSFHRDVPAFVGSHVWEPCAGKGDISHAFKDLGHQVTSTDLIDRGAPDVTGGVDFLLSELIAPDVKAIVTNPPYKFAAQCYERAYDLVPDDGYVIMFLKLTFLETVKRRELFQRCPLTYCYVHAARQECKLGGWAEGESSKGGAAAYAWFVSHKGNPAEPIIRWL